ncbi:uncharacterized protein BDZ99DRAFT_462580 [Mytilinidion resinicola]|uniref:Uncharacterized protein n=1 Tax=Mytilinidion resinicola TaxID=574789 RepID=A0A6A6YM40_9PEZI|nr:uncharacterized protein BDZ99DRAFT_462580 [Mytilinidion resinicola]KAF2809946.1 hypothetical protein BDZ99DRAFT_462580 [Mytilinidion resinicola]
MDIAPGTNGPRSFMSSYVSPSSHQADLTLSASQLLDCITCDGLIQYQPLPLRSAMRSTAARPERGSGSKPHNNAQIRPATPTSSCKLPPETSPSVRNECTQTSDEALSLTAAHKWQA